MQKYVHFSGCWRAGLVLLAIECLSSFTIKYPDKSHLGRTCSFRITMQSVTAVKSTQQELEQLVTSAVEEGNG